MDRQNIRRLLVAICCTFGCWASSGFAQKNPAASAAPTNVTAPATASTATPADRLLPMEATVNSAKSGTWLFLERGGVLYAPREAIDEWRLELKSDVPSIDFKGQPYIPLSAIPDFKAKVDFANQAVSLSFSPTSFAPLRLTKELVKKPLVSPVLPSLFVNYDFSFAGSKFRDGPSTNDLGLLSEIGFSNAWGVLTSSQAGRNLLGNRTLGDSRTWRRLETTFTRDFPDDNRTLRLGDTTSRAGTWGRNAYFGGIQFGTNFALTPGFIRQPLPVLTGLSTAPSTVELYVNDVLRQTSSVPTGPFTLDNFPVMTTGGEARLVVRDLLGRETVITQSFLTNAQLLARGLNDWSLEAGTLRRELGNASNRYGSGFASGTWSRGVTADTTLEGRAEATRDMQVIGISLINALRAQWLGKAAIATSRELSAGNGFHWLIGVDRQGLRSSASFEVRGASRDFRQLGLDATTKPIKLQLAGNWNLHADGGDSFGLGFASITQYEGPRVSTVSGNYSTRVGARGSINLTVSHAIAGATGTAAGATLILPLSDTRIVTSSLTHRRGGDDFYASAAQNPGPSSDLGWRVLTGRQQNQARVEGGIYTFGRYGSLNGDVSFSRDQQALRAGVTGGVVLADGHLFATRRVDESFAVAEVAGFGNVGIGIGSNVLTRTDAKGIALIPRLMPYQNNSVRIDPKELPINAELDTIEQIAVPAWRSAVKVNFPVRSGRGALVKITLDDGDVAPAGATVNIVGDKQEFYVARRGEAFVTGLQPVNRLLLKWQKQECTFELTLPPDAPDEIVRVGPLRCKGVKR